MQETPSIIKRIEQTEIKEIASLLSDCHVLPVAFVRTLLKKRGKKQSQIDNIMNQIVKRKIGFYDEGSAYLRVNKAFASGDVNLGQIKSLWLMLDLLSNIEAYFVQKKEPHMLTFFNKNAEEHGAPPIYDVFYIPFGSETLSTYMMNNIASQQEEPLNCFIILDDETQIPKLDLSKNISVVSYVFVGGNGQVRYINNN